MLDSRDTDEGAATRRRRECSWCGRRFTTYERVEGTMLAVRKKWAGPASGAGSCERGRHRLREAPCDSEADRRLVLDTGTLRDQGVRRF